MLFVRSRRSFWPFQEIHISVKLCKKFYHHHIILKQMKSMSCILQMGKPESNVAKCIQQWHPYQQGHFIVRSYKHSYPNKVIWKHCLEKRLKRIWTTIQDFSEGSTLF